MVRPDGVPTFVLALNHLANPYYVSEIQGAAGLAPCRSFDTLCKQNDLFRIKYGGNWSAATADFVALSTAWNFNAAGYEFVPSPHLNHPYVWCTLVCVCMCVCVCVWCECVVCCMLYIVCCMLYAVLLLCFDIQSPPMVYFSSFASSSSPPSSGISPTFSSPTRRISSPRTTCSPSPTCSATSSTPAPIGAWPPGVRATSTPTCRGGQRTW